MCKAVLMIVGESLFFFFNDTATTEIYTLSLHDALPISRAKSSTRSFPNGVYVRASRSRIGCGNSTPSPTFSEDPKSTRLNSSHSQISYAVFCLKKQIDI